MAWYSILTWDGPIAGATPHRIGRPKRDRSKAKAGRKAAKRR